MYKIHLLPEIYELTEIKAQYSIVIMFLKQSLSIKGLLNRMEGKIIDFFGAHLIKILFEKKLNFTLLYLISMKLEYNS